MCQIGQFLFQLVCVCATNYIKIVSSPAVNTALQPPSSVTQGANTTLRVFWSSVSGATGYYVSYQRQDLGTPPVVTPQYERIVGGASTSVTLSGLEPGTTYRIRVWSTNGTSVSSEAREMDVTTVESGERCITFIWVYVFVRKSILAYSNNSTTSQIYFLPASSFFRVPCDY